MTSAMIDKLSNDFMTKREWNGRDDIHCHYMGRIPLDEPLVTLTLNWKKDKNSRPYLVGKFRLRMDKLVSEDYARKVEGWYILRFQRSGSHIEVAKNHSSRALQLSPLPKEYKI
jgi:hypothetical protein